MTLHLKKLGLQTGKYSSFFDRLRKLNTAMDQEYKKAADHYGFHCTGCRENCCLTRFYHHTYLEYFYILSGFDTLEPETQASVGKKASDVCEKTDDADKKGIKVQLMCPLNFDGLCLLYDYRPMICRLHGISHEFHKPDKSIVHGPGCQVFTEQSEGKVNFKFDRTPFYIEMGRLEMELRQFAGITEKLKMTVAQMLK